MKKLKRIVTVILATVLCLNSIPVYANSEANGTGDGFESNPSTLEDVGSIHQYHVNQGFRIYIVNQKGLAVTNSVDFVKYLPWKIGEFAFGQSVEQMSKMWNDYYNVVGMYRDGSKNNIKYIGGVKTDLWRTQQLYGKINKDGSMPPLDSNGVTYITREIQADSRVSTQYPDKFQSPSKMYTIDYLETSLRNYITEEYGKWSITSKKEDGLKMIEIPDKFDINNGETTYTYNKIMAPIEFLGERKGLVGTGEEMKNLLMMPLSDDINDDVTLLRYLITIQLPAVNGIGSVINNGESTPLFKFTDSTVNNKYTELLAKATTNEDKKQAFIDTVRELKLKVALEPLSWSVPTVTSSKLEMIIPNKWGYIWTDRSIVYGTPTNIVGHVLDNFRANYYYSFKDRDNCPKPTDSGADFIQWLRENDVKLHWQWSMTPRAYRTIKDIPEYDMKAYTTDVEGSIGGEDLASLGENWGTLGFGVMYFGIDAVDGIRTSTWDRKTFPKDDYKPGEAPKTTKDDNSQQSEGADYKKSNKDYKFNIVKFYGEKDESNNIVYTENHVRENTVHNIQISDEVSYKVKEWFTSPEYQEPTSENEAYDDYKSSLEKGDKDGDKAGSVMIPADSKDTTLYVKLIKEIEPDIPTIEAGTSITLHEDEISYPYNMSNIKPSLDEIYFNFPDKTRSGSGSHGDDEDSWSCDWERVLDDGTYSIGLKNSFDYGASNFIGSQGVFIGSEGGKVTTSNNERGANLGGFETDRLIPNWLFVLYRDKVKDKVTLYPNKNSNEVVNNLSLIGIDNSGYIPSNRIAKEDGGSFKSTLAIKYVYETLDKSLSYDSNGCGSHGDSGSYDGTENMYIDLFNSSYSNNDNVITKYYLGKKNDGNIVAEIVNSPFAFDGKTYKIFMSTKNQNHTLKFYPMLKMTYQTQSVGETAVYVTSTNESSVLAPTRVDVGVYKDSARAGLYLDSTQWSTHVKSQSFLNSAGIADKNSVLTGGALYELKTSNSASPGASDNWVGVHTYQVCVPDSAIERLSTSEGVVSESQAKQQLDSFTKQVENVLSKYQIVQWVSKGIVKDVAEFKNASPVLVSGVGQASKFGDNTLDRSGKYYLKVDGTGADRADLDIIDKTHSQIVWGISSDVDGNITVKNDKGLSLTINKVQGVVSLLADADIKLLDDKTKVVTNFVNALDRNKGSDRESNKWYNEAFEEIKVIENYSAFKLGFGGGQEVRGSVLDTKLTGKLADRRDLYNFSAESLAEKTRTSQFKTSARSTDSSANGKASGYIGSIDGMDILIPNIENLMVSKLFYIPNANVTDLN